MSALGHLEALANGDRPQDAGLLGTAKLSWASLDRLSEEDILSLFASHPFPIDDSAMRIETEGGAALVGSGAALLADLYDGRIGRIWRVGDEVDEAEEPVLHVAFDTDMEQGRSTALRYRWEDHPDLPESWWEPLLAASEAVIDEKRRSSALRSRGYIVRAFGDSESAAALLWVFTLSNESKRVASMQYCIVGLGINSETRVVQSRSKTGNWTPRL